MKSSSSVRVKNELKKARAAYRKELEAAGPTKPPARPRKKKKAPKRRKKNPMSVDEALRALELEPGASITTVRAAYRMAVRENHPDRGGSEGAMARINEARDILMEKGTGEAFRLRAPSAPPRGKDLSRLDDDEVLMQFRMVQRSMEKGSSTFKKSLLEALQKEAEMRGIDLRRNPSDIPPKELLHQEVRAARREKREREARKKAEAMLRRLRPTRRNAAKAPFLIASAWLEGWHAWSPDGDLPTDRHERAGWNARAKQPRMSLRGGLVAPSRSKKRMFLGADEVAAMANRYAERVSRKKNPIGGEPLDVRASLDYLGLGPDASDQEVLEAAEELKLTFGGAAPLHGPIVNEIRVNIAEAEDVALDWVRRGSPSAELGDWTPQSEEPPFNPPSFAFLGLEWADEPSKRDIDRAVSRLHKRFTEERKYAHLNRLDRMERKAKRWLKRRTKAKRLQKKVSRVVERAEVTAYADPKSTKVRQTQRALKKLGYYRGNQTSRMTQETSEALAAFQVDQGIEAHGVLTPETEDALIVAAGQTSLEALRRSKRR
jgi:hypothetical protein